VGGKKATTRVDELLFDFAVFKAIERRARDEQQIKFGWHLFLMTPKDLPQTPFGPIALHGPANRRGGCNHTDARTQNRQRSGCGLFFWGDRRHLRSAIRPNRKSAAVLAAAFLPSVAKITLPAQMLLGAETHGVTKNATP
jgi:hypothetical protein